jgi:hypothetical protein
MLERTLLEFDLIRVSACICLSSRSCGLIHCDNCSKYRAPVPTKNYMERVRVCGNCYYALKKKSGGASGGRSSSSTSGHSATASADKKTHSPKNRHGSSSSSSGGGGDTSSSKRGGESSGSAKRSRSSRGSTAEAHALADELQAQLSALHSLHSSYQPEHHYLTSLLSNASQLELTYVATIQYLYAHVQTQQQQHRHEWHTQQATIQAQQRQIEHLEEQLRNAQVAQAAQGKGTSPVLGNRAASPSLAISTASMPSSRASPSSHALSFALSLQQGQAAQAQQPKQLHSAPASSAAAAGLPPMSLTSPSYTQPIFPPLPFALQTPPPLQAATSAQQQRVYDAASEEAYLEPPEEDLIGAVDSNPLAPSTASHPDVLSVTEPPSPPPDSPQSSPGAEEGRSGKRATSNPTGKARQHQRSTSSGYGGGDRQQKGGGGRGKQETFVDPPGSASVQTLLDAIGM